MKKKPAFTFKTPKKTKAQAKAKPRKTNPGETRCRACGGFGRIEPPAPKTGYGRGPADTWPRCKKCGGKGWITTPKKKKAGRTKNAAERLHRISKPGKRTRNDEGLQEVLEQYKGFHGRDAAGVKTHEQTLLYRKDFAKCGRLLDLGVWLDEDRYFVIKPRKVNVVTTGDGGSLYFQGGDQELPLKALGLDKYLPKDYIRVGDVETIAYHTEKGFHNFEPKDYEHTFAEEGGEFPTLNYDTVNKLFFLTGGSYQVRPEGIVN